MALTKQDFKKEQKKKVNYILETSWDDNWHLDLRIANLLKKYNLPGTFYVVVDWVGKEGYMTWDEVRGLDKQGFKIGSHSLSHPQDLKMCHDEQLHLEVQNSKDMIEMVLGHKIESFCYPRGRANERVKRKVMESGYLEARGTGKPGIIMVEDKFYLPGTIHIFQREEYGKQSILEFAKQTIDRVKKEGGYCNIWGHSEEMSRLGLFDILEEVLKYVRKK